MSESKNYQVPEGVYRCNFPETCPICEAHVDIREAESVTVRADSDEVLQVVYRCPARKCSSFFIGYYRVPNDGHGFQLVRFVPRNARIPDLTSYICELSPRAVKVYSQASSALEYGLEELAGPGLRKALEILIKDYAKSHVTATDEKARLAEAEKIDKMFLMPVINEYFKSKPDILKSAKRATWLGNDETHYSRRFENKDINDLVKLFALTMASIQNEHALEEYTKDMPEQ